MHERGEMVRAMVGGPDFGRLVVAVTTSVEMSFGLDGGRVTESAVKERVNLAWDLVLRLRADFKWSVARISDHIAAFLRCELNGIAYDPGAMGTMWNPNNVGAAALTGGR